MVQFQNPLQMSLEETVTIPSTLLFLKHTSPHLPQAKTASVGKPAVNIPLTFLLLHL